MVKATGASREEVLAALEEVKGWYGSPSRGLALEEIAGGYRLVTRPQYASVLEKLFARPYSPLSRAALETLAIVAYRQPITRLEIESIRGIKSESVIATLVERGLIKEVGRGDGPGRPVLYGTTNLFLEYFGLRDISELPPIETAQPG